MTFKPSCAVVIASFNTSDIPVVEARVSAKGVDLSESYELIEARILNRIRRIPGVARVDLDGVSPREIFIDLVLNRVAMGRDFYDDVDFIGYITSRADSI